MRILQVVTYISPDGAYGGPVRVAVNQAKALTDLGHEVVLAAAAGGFGDSLPDEFDGFPVQLFPAHQLIPGVSFSGLVSPKLIAWLPSALKSADVVHVHLARDLVTLPTAVQALLIKKPLVVQTHGMIDATEKRLALPLDNLVTKPVLRHASAVFYLTDRERQDLMFVGGRELKLEHLPNGVEIPEEQAIEQMQGFRPDPEILFLSRLHIRKRPMAFVQAAQALQAKWPEVRYCLVGPDEGETRKVQNYISDNHLHGRVALSGPISPNRTGRRMQQSSIYVLPSVEEPFPMSVLEAMARGLPVVITNTCGLAPIVHAQNAGIVCDHTQESLIKALNLLIENPEMRQKMGQQARALIVDKFTMKSVALQLSEFYRRVL